MDREREREKQEKRHAREFIFDLILKCLFGLFFSFRKICEEGPPNIFFLFVFFPVFFFLSGFGSSTWYPLRVVRRCVCARSPLLDVCVTSVCWPSPAVGAERNNNKYSHPLYHHPTPIPPDDNPKDQQRKIPVNAQNTTATTTKFLLFLLLVFASKISRHAHTRDPKIAPPNSALILFVCLCIHVCENEIPNYWLVPVFAVFCRPGGIYCCSKKEKKKTDEHGVANTKRFWLSKKKRQTCSSFLSFFSGRKKNMDFFVFKNSNRNLIRFSLYRWRGFLPPYVCACKWMCVYITQMNVNYHLFSVI